ncbi:saccharopine dehydrogenase NADP-binding domain-containing protein [Sphingomonas aliaeris]|uniref:Saccharopine dehydrogenase NADP-binding domain-containing protein n=1 Tax=Sphingomonas aliaeris TaxID=2759526 RepID=A0A974S600_9SPHN|nr:saccharopine dehydrogenase NADP-binding domain-containing protein [Sphingomonas aliaeris]QQV78550.1 saccharopine dehydrogenase NADP-binding domain-containing protein [Sphingomonas aliaeris]
MAKDFDIIVYGATGFTGRLVAEYLVQTGATRWAMAGRSLTKLQEVRDEIGAPADTPLIVANSDDPASLKTMCERTQVVLTTVGPYQLYGNDLVAACAETGTAYVDLCGEPAWMRKMIDAHHETAKRTGARIVFSCGFDSIPFDLGVLTLQEAAKEKFGQAAPRVKCRVRKMQGTFSGGTAASLKATLAAAAREPSILGLLIDPFALAPGFSGPSQPKGMLPEYDSTIGAWVAPFIMAPINTKNVHRTNFLLGQTYGADFVYDEMMVAPGIGDMGKAAAEAIARINPMTSDKGPKPGEGPSKEERDAGFYDLLFIGELPDGRRIDAVVTGDRDPGYGSTSKMIAEAALCLVHDVQAEGGIWTPGAIMAAPLRKRLIDNAGLTFTAG